MAKILNLDSFAQDSQRELHLRGKVYAIKEMSVQDFIDTSRLAEQMEGEKSFAAQMDASVQMIKKSIPDIDESALRSLSLEQMAAVSKFVRGEDPTPEPKGDEPGKA